MSLDQYERTLLLAAREATTARVEVGTVSVEPALSPRQLEVWRCRERVIKLLCGRQSGKTYWACVWLLAGALEVPRSLSVYLALTQTSAREIAWDELEHVGTTVFGLPSKCFREHTLSVRLPNRSRIIVKGTDDRRTIESWRGTKLHRAVIDEMGSQMPDLIQYFVQDIIWPALVRFNGRLALLGTPGLVSDGYWWEQTCPEAMEQPGAFHWTIYENPAIPHADAFIEETLETFGWTRESPQFLREWMAEWQQDPGAIVYPFELARNGIDRLPERTETGIIIPPSAWRYVIGNDVGVVDECAWVVWAWSPPWRGSIAVDCHIEQLDPDPAAVKGREIFDRYKDRGQTDYILDTGGIGKTHERIYRNKYGIPVIVAEKSEKASAIRVLRGDLLSGAARVLNDAHMTPLRSQWACLGWCPKKLQHNPNQPDHLADSGLYGHRRIRHYTHNPNLGRPQPDLGTPERRMKDYEAFMEKRARRRRRNESRYGGLER